MRNKSGCHSQKKREDPLGSKIRIKKEVVRLGNFRKNEDSFKKPL